MNPTHEAYIRERFDQVVVLSDPFPHFVLYEVLPPDLYNAMERALPPRWRWKLAAFGETFRHRGMAEAWRQLKQGEFIAQPHFGVRAPDVSAHFGLSSYRRHWKGQFGPMLELVDSLTAKVFEPHLISYQQKIVAAGVPLGAKWSLGQAIFCQRGREWTIDRHTHYLGQVIQSLIYFPLPGSSADQGTLLYRIKQSMQVPAREFYSTRIFGPEEVEAATLLPYQANCMVSFMNTPYAVHSTSTAAGPPRRYILGSVQVQIDASDAMLSIG
ncbi:MULTISPECIES: hypothetical protein [unclassified Bradyrhizobium]|uniref:hypothetical protein n=1 Tax=unclassified Bradyrhizobium TaxID=2631580 RepID=UPI002916B73D|nr:MULTISPECIES: hypothetical protein [unclassified Bradyrhizobium]